MNYTKLTSDFKDTLQYCEKNHMYLGEGNPNSKILIIGKEIGLALNEDKTPSIDKSNEDNNLNLIHWRTIIERNDLDVYLENIKNSFNETPNRTWANYQKIVNEILGYDSSERKFDFLDNTFITELSQIRLANSSQANTKELKLARQNSIEKRKSLFKLDFFQSFPIIIMACGHYAKDFDFDIEKIFNVKWTGETVVLSKANFYNVHFGKTANGDDRILIHTRQVSMTVTNDLLKTIGEVSRQYYS